MQLKCSVTPHPTISHDAATNRQGRAWLDWERENGLVGNAKYCSQNGLFWKSEAFIYQKEIGFKGLDIYYKKLQ